MRVSSVIYPRAILKLPESGKHDAHRQDKGELLKNVLSVIPFDRLTITQAQ